MLYAWTSPARVMLCYAIALAWYAVASTQDVLCRVVPRGVNLTMSDSPLRVRRSQRTRYANATVQIIVRPLRQRATPKRRCT